MKLPAGLNNRRCERFHPAKMGGLPPTCFVPEKHLEGTDKMDDKSHKNCVKISISENVSKCSELFEEGGPEAVIMLIRSYESLVRDRKLREVYSSASALINAQKSAIAGLDQQRDRVMIEELTDAINELKTTCKVTQEEAFDYFEQLLSLEHVPKWREIVKEQCDTVPYIDLKGKKQTNKARGRVFDALEPCYIQVRLTVTVQDAAERHRRYWTTTVKISEEFASSVLIERMKWANKIVKYLPCMKHVESSPAQWPTMNLLFLEIEMCIHVIATLPMNLAVAYWTSKGQHFPVCLKTLGDDLKLVEAQVNRSQRMMDDVRKHAGLPPRNGANKGNRASTKDDGGRIPKKPKASTAAASEGGRPKKHCALCAKHSP